MATTENQAGPANDQGRRTVEVPDAVDGRSLNLPNLITLSRLVLAGVLFVMIDYEGWWRSAAALFVFAAATDFVDGYIARRFGMVTTLGRILDPFVDKIIICGAFVFLLKKDSGVTDWMVIIVIGREMFVTSLRAFLEQHGKDFSASWSGKIKMAVQCVAVTGSLLSLSPDVQAAFPDFNVLRDVVLWTAVGVTAYSGITYSQRAILLLRPNAES